MRRLTRIEITLITGAVLIALLVVGVYFGTFGAGFTGLSHHSERWGQFGEYVGGSLGAFFGFLAFIGVLVTLRSQRAQADLDEIQRLIAKTSDRIDQILHSQPLQMDTLRIDRGERTTTFDDFRSLAAIALVEGLIPEAEKKASRIEEGQRYLRYEWTRLHMEFSLLTNLLIKYAESGGSKTVSSAYQSQHQLTVAYMRAVGFWLPPEVQQYFHGPATMEDIRHKWNAVPVAQPSAP